MKIVEDYAQRKVDEAKKELNTNFVINLANMGFSFDMIAEAAEVSLDFVKQTLSK